MISITQILTVSFLISLFFLNTNAAVIQSNFVKFDVDHIRHGTNQSLVKRSNDRTALNDRHSYYTTTLKFGSTKQSVDLLVDSGSADMFVIDSSACPSACSAYGTFKKSLSKTIQTLKTKFVIYYGSGKATGLWVKDAVTVGSVTIPKQQFAIATTFPSKMGVFGVGVSPDTNKLSVQYPNYPKSLKTAGHINKIAYSFYAGNYGTNRGHLLFGAVDMAKVSGKLIKINMVSASPRTPTIPLNGMSLDSSYAPIKSKTLSTKKVSMLIDTGTSVTLIPQDAFNNLVSSLKATKCTSGYCVDCGLINKNINVKFSFPGITIKTPLSDLVYQNSATSCMLGVQGSSSMYIFGADALRSTYVVFDLEDYAIYLGAAKNAATAQNIKIITKTVPTS